MRTPALLLVAVLPLACTAAPETGGVPAALESGHFRTSDGVELHYLEAGSGPALVFVPGWTMPAEIWEPQLRHFASTHRVVALDPRGQGRSEKPTHGYHASRRALDIGELLEHLGDEPAAVVGWSIAVQEILVYAHEHGTDRLRAAVLVDLPVDLGDDIEFARARITNVQLNREEYTREFIEAIHRTPQPEEYLEAMTRASLSMPTNAAAMITANVLLLGPTDLGPALESLDRPVLFLFSSLDWAIEAAGEVREGWPDVQVEVIDDTSHALFVDRPAEFNRVLEAFVAALPE